ncbi:cysteine synthase [Candidatus Methanomassiliicoccus intestinalis Issoire-Mx1]|uniref:Cysteine synthase n=2 Tax=Candidatus Methanomassiliicoccus intestinalis TaxID=1406512 RepID=R9TAM4_METII|nr:cysteine synthase [Candidatus Methanomassiliicoccus intestinalis Issoire-Mx1]
MTMVAYDSILDTIGKTPIVKLNKMAPEGSHVYVKIESFNPAGSIKDRAVLRMIDDAEEKGLLKKGGIIVEPTSGNTGIAIALVAAARGYRAIITIPDTMSKERTAFMKAYGAEIVYTPGKDGMAGAVEKAEELCRELGAFMPMQFSNSSNIDSHYMTTANEILKDLPDVDYVFAGIGTGGTASGIGRSLRDSGSKGKVIGVEPAESPLITEGRSGPHKIQGIGSNFIPDNYDPNAIHQVVTVKGDDAIATAVRLAKEEGIFAGISSGAAVFAALQQAEKEKGKIILAILPDGGERYVSLGIYD